MQLISCHHGKLQTLSAAAAGLKRAGAAGRSFVTGLPALDALAPRQSLARGAVHELLFDRSHAPPSFVAALVARAAADDDDGSPGASFPIIWSDPRGEIYPPALAALGLDLAKIYLLRPASAADEAWALTECLRCRGVAAVVAQPQRLSRIEARRLQLAAERGGAVGLLLRPAGRGDAVYAAATRWLVTPAPGERTVQRWTIQLIHGHGGRVGQTVILEWCREDNSVRAVDKLADRPAATPAEKSGDSATATIDAARAARRASA